MSGKFRSSERVPESKKDKFLWKTVDKKGYDDKPHFLKYGSKSQVLPAYAFAKGHSASNMLLKVI